MQLRRFIIVTCELLGLGILSSTVSAGEITKNWLLDLKTPADTVEILTGLELLVRNDFQVLGQQNMALLANSGSVLPNGKHIGDIFKEQYRGKVKAFIIVNEEEARPFLSINISATESTGSARFTFLDTKNYRLTAEMLHDAAVLVIDLQDNGWWNSSSLLVLIEALRFSAERALPILLLDRPNPLGAQKVEGPLAQLANLPPEHKLPLRHGLTLGELALLIAGERWLGKSPVKLQVVPMAHYRRRDDLASWRRGAIPIRIPGTSRDCAYLSGGMQLLATTNLSYGEGTDSIFEVVGAPWISEKHLTEMLKREKLPGVTFYPVEFTPRLLVNSKSSPRYRDETCAGVLIRILDWQAFESVRTALTVGFLTAQLYPHHFSWQAPEQLAPFQDHTDIQAVIDLGGDLQGLFAAIQASLSGYQKLRMKYLIYD